jgi:hypothetical protein
METLNIFTWIFVGCTAAGAIAGWIVCSIFAARRHTQQLEFAYRLGEEDGVFRSQKEALQKAQRVCEKCPLAQASEEGEI